MKSAFQIFEIRFASIAPKKRTSPEIAIERLVNQSTFLSTNYG